MPNTLHVDYELMTHDETVKVVEAAMEIARKEIPKGAVADYIPELGKVDPNQLGICIYPLQGDKILLGDYDKRAGIGVFGPSLDAKGNSIAGCRLLKEIANKLRLSLFYDTDLRSADIKDYSLTEFAKHEG